MLQLEEDNFSKLTVENNLEDKEQVIMRDDELATIIKQKEKDEDHKSMEKEQRAMTLTPTGEALLLVWHVLSLHNFPQSSIPQNLGVASKVTTLEMDSIFFFADCLLHLQAVFRVAKKSYCGRRVSLHKLVIARDDLHQWIDELHRKDHQ